MASVKESTGIEDWRRLYDEFLCAERGNETSQKSMPVPDPRWPTQMPPPELSMTDLTTPVNTKHVAAPVTAFRTASTNALHSDLLQVVDDVLTEEAAAVEKELLRRLTTGFTTSYDKIPPSYLNEQPSDHMCLPAHKTQAEAEELCPQASTTNGQTLPQRQSTWLTTCSFTASQHRSSGGDHSSCTPVSAWPADANIVARSSTPLATTATSSTPSDAPSDARFPGPHRHLQHHNPAVVRASADSAYSASSINPGRGRPPPRTTSYRLPPEPASALRHVLRMRPSAAAARASVQSPPRVTLRDTSPGAGTPGGSRLAPSRQPPASTYAALHQRQTSPPQRQAPLEPREEMFDALHRGLSPHRLRLIIGGNAVSSPGTAAAAVAGGPSGGSWPVRGSRELRQSTSPVRPPVSASTPQQRSAQPQAQPHRGQRLRGSYSPVRQSQQPKVAWAAPREQQPALARRRGRQTEGFGAIPGHGPTSSPIVSSSSDSRQPRRAEAGQGGPMPRGDGRLGQDGIAQGTPGPMRATSVSGPWHNGGSGANALWERESRFQDNKRDSQGHRSHRGGATVAAGGDVPPGVDGDGDSDPRPPGLAPCNEGPRRLPSTPMMHMHSSSVVPQQRRPELYISPLAYREYSATGGPAGRGRAPSQPQVAQHPRGVQPGVASGEGDVHQVRARQQRLTAGLDMAAAGGMYEEEGLQAAWRHAGGGLPDAGRAPPYDLPPDLDFPPEGEGAMPYMDPTTVATASRAAANGRHAVGVRNSQSLELEPTNDELLGEREWRQYGRPRRDESRAPAAAATYASWHGPNTEISPAQSATQLYARYMPSPVSRSVGQLQQDVVRAPGAAAAGAEHRPGQQRVVTGKEGSVGGMSTAALSTAAVAVMASAIHSARTSMSSGAGCEAGSRSGVSAQQAALSGDSAGGLPPLDIGAVREQLRAMDTSSLELIRGYASGYIDGRVQALPHQGQIRSQVVKAAVLRLVNEALQDKLEAQRVMAAETAAATHESAGDASGKTSMVQFHELLVARMQLAASEVETAAPQAAQPSYTQPVTSQLPPTNAAAATRISTAAAAEAIAAPADQGTSSAPAASPRGRAVAALPSPTASVTEQLRAARGSTHSTGGLATGGSRGLRKRVSWQSDHGSPPEATYFGVEAADGVTESLQGIASGEPQSPMAPWYYPSSPQPSAAATALPHQQPVMPGAGASEADSPSDSTAHAAPYLPDGDDRDAAAIITAAAAAAAAALSYRSDRSTVSTTSVRGGESERSLFPSAAMSRRGSASAAHVVPYIADDEDEPQGGITRAVEGAGPPHIGRSASTNGLVEPFRDEITAWADAAAAAATPITDEGVLLVTLNEGTREYGEEDEGRAFQSPVFSSFSNSCGQLFAAPLMQLVAKQLLPVASSGGGNSRDAREGGCPAQENVPSPLLEPRARLDDMTAAAESAAAPGDVASPEMELSPQLGKWGTTSSPRALGTFSALPLASTGQGQVQDDWNGPHPSVRQVAAMSPSSRFAVLEELAAPVVRPRGDIAREAAVGRAVGEHVPFSVGGGSGGGSREMPFLQALTPIPTMAVSGASLALLASDSVNRAATPVVGHESLTCGEEDPVADTVSGEYALAATARASLDPSIAVAVLCKDANGEEEAPRRGIAAAPVAAANAPPYTRPRSAAAVASTGKALRAPLAWYRSPSSGLATPSPRSAATSPSGIRSSSASGAKQSSGTATSPTAATLRRPPSLHRLRTASPAGSSSGVPSNTSSPLTAHTSGRPAPAGSPRRAGGIMLSKPASAAFGSPPQSPASSRPAKLQALSSSPTSSKHAKAIVVPERGMSGLEPGLARTHSHSQVAVAMSLSHRTSSGVGAASPSAAGDELRRDSLKFIQQLEAAMAADVAGALAMQMPMATSQEEHDGLEVAQAAVMLPGGEGSSEETVEFRGTGALSVDDDDTDDVNALALGNVHKQQAALDAASLGFDRQPSYISVTEPRIEERFSPCAGSYDEAEQAPVLLRQISDTVAPVTPFRSRRALSYEPTASRLDKPVAPLAAVLSSVGPSSSPMTDATPKLASTRPSSSQQLLQPPAPSPTSASPRPLTPIATVPDSARGGKALAPTDAADAEEFLGPWLLAAGSQAVTQLPRPTASAAITDAARKPAASRVDLLSCEPLSADREAPSMSDLQGPRSSALSTSIANGTGTSGASLSRVSPPKTVTSPGIAGAANLVSPNGGSSSPASSSCYGGDTSPSVVTLTARGVAVAYLRRQPSDAALGMAHQRGSPSIGLTAPGADAETVISSPTGQLAPGARVSVSPQARVEKSLAGRTVSPGKSANPSPRSVELGGKGVEAAAGMLLTAPASGMNLARPPSSRAAPESVCEVAPAAAKAAGAAKTAPLGAHCVTTAATVTASLPLGPSSSSISHSSEGLQPPPSAIPSATPATALGPMAAAVMGALDSAGSTTDSDVVVTSRASSARESATLTSGAATPTGSGTCTPTGRGRDARSIEPVLSELRTVRASISAGADADGAQAVRMAELLTHLNSYRRGVERRHGPAHSIVTQLRILHSDMSKWLLQVTAATPGHPQPNTNSAGNGTPPPPAAPVLQTQPAQAPIDNHAELPRSRPLTDAPIMNAVPPRLQDKCDASTRSARHPPRETLPEPESEAGPVAGLSSTPVAAGSGGAAVVTPPSASTQPSVLMRNESQSSVSTDATFDLLPPTASAATPRGSALGMPSDVFAFPQPQLEETRRSGGVAAPGNKSSSSTTAQSNNSSTNPPAAFPQPRVNNDKQEGSEPFMGAGVGADMVRHAFQAGSQGSIVVSSGDGAQMAAGVAAGFGFHMSSSVGGMGAQGQDGLGMAPGLGHHALSAGGALGAGATADCQVSLLEIANQLNSMAMQQQQQQQQSKNGAFGLAPASGRGFLPAGMRDTVSGKQISEADASCQAGPWSVSAAQPGEPISAVGFGVVPSTSDGGMGSSMVTRFPGSARSQSVSAGGQERKDQVFPKPKLRSKWSAIFGGNKKK